MTEIELEYTFLAKFLSPEVRENRVKPTRIIDIYIPDTQGHSHLRLRAKIRENDEKYEITKKLPLKNGDASAQTENTIPLTKAEFDALAKSSDKCVVKDRFNLQIENREAEVDVFREKLGGLVLIDFEFSSEEEKRNFAKPQIALADVTQEDFIAGGMLAGKSFAEITLELARFGYEKLN